MLVLRVRKKTSPLCFGRPWTQAGRGHVVPQGWHLTSSITSLPSDTCPTKLGEMTRMYCFKPPLHWNREHVLHLLEIKKVVKYKASSAVLVFLLEIDNFCGNIFFLG